MKGRCLAIVAALVLACLPTISNAQPHGREVRLHDVVSPPALFPDTSFRYQRSAQEQEAGGGALALAPIFRAGLLDDGTVRFAPGSLMLAPLYKYNDLQDAQADPVELMRAAAQDKINLTILPAAQRVDWLNGPDIQSMSVVVRDLEDAVIEAPRWDGSDQASPSIVIKYGFTHVMTGHAHIALQFDRALALSLSPSPEAISGSFSRFLNVYYQVLSSSRQRRTDDRQFFDRALFDAALPVSWTAQDHLTYRRHIDQLFPVVLAHEACHLLLGHTSRTAGDRRQQEFEADICAAAVFVAASPQVWNGEDRRLFHFIEAANYISLASLINWPRQAGGTYPTPDERHAAVFASIPDSVRQASPELAAELPRLKPLTSQVTLEATTDLLPVLLDADQRSAPTLLAALGEVEFLIAGEIASVGCRRSDIPQGERTSYYCARLAVDRAAILVEMSLIRARSEPADLALIDDLLRYADQHLARYATPVLAQDRERLNADWLLAQSLAAPAH